MSWTTLASGDAVEVLSGDGDGDATWRPAIIVHPFISRRLFFLVFDDAPERATVPAERVRPRPDPTPSEFELHQLVDARVGGAWKAGVVSKVHVTDRERGMRFGVCFPFAREEAVFGSPEMRARLDWVDGKWISAQKMGTTETKYNDGSQVEVAHIIKNHLIAWYTATVMKIVDEKILLVEYESLKTEDGILLTEIVASQYIRPCLSPKLGVKNFDLSDKVEAFYNGGWWPGVVAKVNAGSRCDMKFMHCEEVIEFSHTELRLLYDWVDGQWVQASQEKAVNPQTLHASNTTPGLVARLTGFGDEALCHFPTSNGNSGIDNTDGVSSQSQLECLHPCKKAKKGETIEENTRLLDFRGTEISKGAETSTDVKAGFDVRTPITQEKPIFHIKSLVEKCSDIHFKMMNVVGTAPMGKPSSSILSEDPPMHRKLSPESILFHKSVSNEADDILEEKPVNQKFIQTADQHQLGGVWCPSHQEEQELPKCECDKGVRQNEPGEKRRKSNKPRKLRIVDPSLEGDSTGNQLDNTMVFEPQMEELSTAKCGPCSENSLEARLINATGGSPDASLVETSASCVHLSEAGSEAQLSDVDKQAKSHVIEKPGDAFKHKCDKPPQEQAKSHVIEKPGDAFKHKCDKPPQEHSPLPFEKRSDMWDPLEAMEAFSLMPQHPHFRPLEQYCKDIREGMAIGLMVTFSNLVTSIGKLQITDPPHKFDGILRTLVILETNGFDVRHLQDRLRGLLRVKENKERLINERSAVEDLLVKEKTEKDRLDAETEMIEKNVRDLQQALSRLHREKTHISEQRRKCDSKLGKLETDSSRIKDALLSTDCDFAAMVSAIR